MVLRIEQPRLLRMVGEESPHTVVYGRIAKAGHAFSPSAPISRVTLFAGRHQQVMRSIDIVYRRGQHGIIFGERGVGKTSMANLIADFISQSDKVDAPPKFLTPRVNCTAGSDYDSIWREVFGRISYFENSGQTGLAMGNFASALKDKKLDPGTVQNILEAISTQQDLIIVIDEFDRLRDSKSRRLMADTLKTLSDHSINATIFLVGVADTVDQLIAEHQSVARALMQIQMQRMEDDEIKEIIHKGLDRFNSQSEDFQLHATDEAIDWIITLARGLPHYAHLLAQKACYSAIQEEEPEISRDHVMQGVSSAHDEIQQSTLSSYDTAVYSAHKNATLSETLVACALAQTDRLGFFAPRDVQNPLSRIRKRERLQIASFSNHLEEFCESKRGAVLEKRGDKRRVRYRFTDSLMAPYVIMRALSEGKIDPKMLSGNGETQLKI
jgi:Cdc6-like AAA superfamily ATPase